MEQLLVFCDEFGNTGTRLLDPDQRVLVYAYLLTDLSSTMKLREELQLLYRKERLDLGELKSVQLLGSGRGRRRYIAIGELLRSLGARIFLSIVEKRYHACAMIIETFLDPFIHDCAPPQMRFPKFRQKFADACYDILDDRRVAEVVDTINADCARDIAALGERLRTTMQFHPDDFVSHAASCMETRAEAVFRYRLAREGLPKGANLPASQYMGFYPGLQCVERYLASVGARAFVVRDEDAQFGDALDAAIDRGRELDEHPGGGDYGAIQIGHITGSRSASSAQELGVQLADLAAGLFGRVAHSLVTSERVPQSLVSVADAWRECFVPSATHYMLVSDAKLPKIRAEIFGENSQQV